VLPEDQVIRFADIGGRSTAWSSVGSGPPLIVGGWWSSHLELDWADAAFRHFIARLAEHRTVIRYDRPGTGLSDRTVPPATSLDAELETLTALLDELDLGPADLLGASSGALVAAAYAAAHPERVDRLVLYGAYAVGRDIAPPSALDAMLTVVQQHWGLGSRVLSDVFLPNASAAERAAFAEFQRRSASRDVAHASLRAVYEFDGSEFLPRVGLPTLVLHRRDDRAIPFALGRDVARRIPGARFAALEGADHFPWRGDSDSAVRGILEFLGVRLPPRESVAPPAELSERELEVLRLVARGLTDQEIAAQLVLSAHTVHRHVANVRTKLGVASRAAAAAWAAERDLI
jgi:pimeloyl-ACP methyl ester carboxylesterase/DNA-binding CsgD family transcriptional regulator